MKNLSVVSEELFNKIRGRFPGVTIGNEAGEVTNDPTEARFFDFNFKARNLDLGKVSVSISEDEGLTVIYSQDFITNEDEITQNKWYDFLKELRFFAKKRLLNFDTRDITKNNLNKRDYKFLSQNRSGEETMTESRLYGTSQTSYQDIDGARLVIKHTKPVNVEMAAGRTQHVGKIYIESAEGERFKYPYKHLNGARAMARHVAEGGNAYDDFGKHIVGLSEEMAKLRKFKNYMGRSAVMAESLAGYMDIVKERISTVKKTIESLQKPTYYKEAIEGFEVAVMEDVPSEVAENWIDELTIRQFNEELQDVFPYIYKLVGEATRAKELGPEDLDEALQEQRLDEFWTKIIPWLAGAGRAAAGGAAKNPKIVQGLKKAADAAKAGGIGQSAKTAAQATAKVAGTTGSKVADIAKGAAKAAGKNPLGTAAQLGVGGYLAKQGLDAADDVSKAADDWSKAAGQASDTMSGIEDKFDSLIGAGKQKLGDVSSDVAEVKDKLMSVAAATGAKIKDASVLGNLAELAVKYAIPFGLLVMVIFGGFKILKWIFEDNASPEALNALFEAERLEEAEKQKGVDGKACWKGYKRMGTKKKGGKTVDNCVKMEDQFEEALDSIMGQFSEAANDCDETCPKSCLDCGGTGDPAKYKASKANENLEDINEGIGSILLGGLGILVLLGQGLKMASITDMKQAKDAALQNPEIIAKLKDDPKTRKLALQLAKDKNKGKEYSQSTAAKIANSVKGYLQKKMIGAGLGPKESVDGGPTPSQMSDEDLADYIGASVEEVKADRDHAEEVANDISRDHAEYEGKAKDLDKDGDIDSDDYMKAKDIAIKKAMGKDKKEKTPLGEFILSYFDRETGQFPKGETAVLTMVEKDYGEQFIQPAKQFIEQVYQVSEEYYEPVVDNSEFERMRELAGIR